MPFTTDQLSEAGKLSLDYHLKNKPIDQVKVDRPWVKKLMASQKEFPGSKQNITETLRYRYQNNFQFYNGRKVVTYNVRHVNEQASYPWRSAHDGFSLDEDRLDQNGIHVSDDRNVTASDDEVSRLSNLLNEQTEALKLGFMEKFDQALLGDGTASTDDIAGLDHLVSTTPTTGTVGSINRATAGNEYWRNFQISGLTTTTTTGTILDKMEIYWRNCTRNGGMPNFIMAGSDFIDGYRNFLMKTYHTIETKGGGVIDLEGGTKMMTFKGVPIVWNPIFSEMDTLFSPAIAWEKRCYFLNMNYIKLRPMEGRSMQSRKPPRPYDRYEHYWALTWKGGLTMNRGNAHAVLSIA